MRLEQELERITEEEGGDSDNLQDIYDRYALATIPPLFSSSAANLLTLFVLSLDSLDAVTAPKRAGELLHGLGLPLPGCTSHVILIVHLRAQDSLRRCRRSPPSHSQEGLRNCRYAR